MSEYDQAFWTAYSEAEAGWDGAPNLAAFRRGFNAGRMYGRTTAFERETEENTDEQV